MGSLALITIVGARLRLGCTSFGGGTAGWLHREIVLRRRWLDDPTFLVMLTIGQALPGSNGIKLTVLIGQHLRGVAGAAVALGGLLAGPFAIVLAIAGVYAGLTGQKTLHDMLDGVAAAVIGLTFATGLRSVVHGAPEPIALFALSRAAPGPGSMLAALIGWKAAGVSGALVATAALYLPSAVLVYGVGRLWSRWRGSLWHTAIEHGLAPIAAGLLLSGGIVVLRASPAGWPVWLSALAATAVLLRWPNLHPVPLLLAGAALFGLIAAF